MQPNSPPSLSADFIAPRLRAEWRLKLLLLFVLNFWVYAPYLFLQRHHFFPSTQMPLSFLDRLIPFLPETIVIYLSIYLLMPIGPFLMTRRSQILRYAGGIALIGLAAATIFFFWPTTCPRPAAIGTNVLYQSVAGIDNPYHAFPSLHAAFAIYSARCGIMVLRELKGPGLFEFGLWLWAFLILLATLTTKQHVVADIAAGSGLGFGVYSCVFRNSKSAKLRDSTLQPVITNLNSKIL